MSAKLANSLLPRLLLICNLLIYAVMYRYDAAVWVWALFGSISLIFWIGFIIKYREEL